MPDVPPKAYLDSRDDQLMAAVRDARAELAETGGTELLALGEALAVLLREQFPAEAGLGRITLAVAKALASVQGAAESRRRRPYSRIELAVIGGLAAEQLDREGAGRG